MKKRVCLVVLHGGKRLLKEKALLVLKRLTLDHAHWLGKAQPQGITGKCPYKHGYHYGAGVCLVRRFIDRESKCRNCLSQEPIRQLNEVFMYCKPFAGKDLTAILK